MSSIYLTELMFSVIYFPLGIILGYGYGKKGWLYAMMPPLLIETSYFLLLNFSNKFYAGISFTIYLIIFYIGQGMVIGLAGGILGQLIDRKINANKLPRSKLTGY